MYFFKRVLLEEELNVSILNEIKDDAYEYTLNYPLTDKQKEISNLCLKNIEHNDVLIEAVCGAEKQRL